MRSARRQPDAGEPLTDGELRIMALVAEGLTNKEVGEKLHLSASTIHTHLTSIARKLGTGRRAGMVAVAMRKGLIA